jgi:hypothetical protein
MNWKATGGVRGALMVAALAALGTVIPFRFRFMFQDPMVIVPYVAVAALMASYYAAWVFADPGEREQLERGDGSGDYREILRRAFWGAAYGWAAWAVIFGASLVMLAGVLPARAIPPLGVLVPLALFAFAAAWFMSCAAAAVGLNVYTVKAARDLLRLGFFFFLLLALAAPRVLPGAWTREVSRLLVGERFPTSLLVAALGLGALGFLLAWRGAAVLRDRRQGLHIV